MSSKNYSQFTKLLVSAGFLATNDGYFVKIENGNPIVVYYNWRYQYWCLDTVNETIKDISIEQLKEKINL